LHPGALCVPPLGSPQSAFSEPRINASKPAAAFSFSPRWSRSLVTAFPSPATAAPSQRPPFQGQRSRPATSGPANWLPCPFGPSAPSPPTGSPRLWATSQLLARCSSTRQLDRPLPLPPLPFRTFTSLRIKAFSSFRCPSTRLPTPPDFLSLPAAGSISRVGHGSTFLVRYVAGD
jgi:hypothetical protein